MVAVIVVVFWFAPLLPTTAANFAGGPNFTAWVSPSFVLFQCGVTIGHVAVEVPNGAVVNPAEAPTFWNCIYPRM
jgi:hypothetical protein